MSQAESAIVRVALPVPLPQLFDYILEDACDADVGRCVTVPFGRGEKHGVIVARATTADVPVGRLKAVTHVQREVAPLPPDWLELAAFVARYYHAPLGEVIATALPPGLRRADTVQARAEDPFLVLTSAGQAALAETRRESRALALTRAVAEASVTARRSEIRLWPDGQAVADAVRRGWIAPGVPREASHAAAAGPTLTAEQRTVIDSIAARETEFAAWLLHGVTGSGKTEVYLNLAERALARNRQVLMLVPEIGLTPQLEAHVAARFPFSNVVSLHSAQADGMRSRGFLQALTGEADIVLGTRLAVFTPLPRLGLVLVDEEHDASYKQQEGIRYSARDLAVWRAHQRAVPVVLGSATPSLESWQQARLGRYELVRMAARAVSRTLPRVVCIDTRRGALDEGLSPALGAAIKARLERGEQSLVFLNRRGYAPVLSCTACGWISGCPHCSAKLVVHLADKRMRCHHCGCDAPVPPACPVCGNQDVQPFGRGTQRVETHLQTRFPQARVLRLDRDVARTRAQWQALLAQVAAGDADILVGTQMMAKGHDFPKLTLVGVVGADASLHAADFRAPERLFQQLMQVGGRAGRAALPGEVLIQTEYPDHPLYRSLVEHDYDGFATRELEEREVAGFPPYSYQAMLRADAPELATATAFLETAREQAEALGVAGVRIFDPVPMRMQRLARRERAQLLVEADERAVLQVFVRRWLESVRAQRATRALRWQLDVDPLEV